MSDHNAPGGSGGTGRPHGSNGESKSRSHAYARGHEETDLPQSSRQPGKAATDTRRRRHRKYAHLTTPYVDVHALERFRERVDQRCTYEQSIVWLREFVTQGTRLQEPPEWMSPVPGCVYFSHQDWGPNVVAVYRRSDNAIITVRVPLPPGRPPRLREKADIMRGYLEADTIAARAVFRRDRRISATG